jgi:hypothetical protein
VHNIRIGAATDGLDTVSREFGKMKSTVLQLSNTPYFSRLRKDATICLSVMILPASAHADDVCLEELI